MMVETIVAKRDLGEGHWDKKLMKRMVELSVADNYEDAKEEWLATGNVWWGGGLTDDIPEWVTQSSMGYGKCLCGHSVVYHFEIVNTENGTVECVGSDHINTYLIMKAISMDTGRSVLDITQGEIDEWIQSRTKNMIAEAWMFKNGKMFNEIYERVKEIDILTNVKGTPYLYFNHTEKEYVWGANLRKKSKYQPTDTYYQMASIVWRWEHPENSKAQSRTRGYPTDKLWQDMIIFNTMCRLKHKERYDRMILKSKEKNREYRERMENQRIAREKREAEEAERLRIYNLPENVEKRRLEAEAKKKAHEKYLEEQRILREQRDRERFERGIKRLSETQTNETFIEMCQYYGIEPFGVEIASTTWETHFLSDMVVMLNDKKPLNGRQLDKLKGILVNNTATEAQRKYLADLGYEGPMNINRKKASEEIKRLKEMKNND